MIIIIQKFILDDFCWSFSSLDTYDRCPLCFYKQYIKCLPSTGGCFDQFGTLCHNCLEKYAKGELAEYELSKEYKDNFDNIITGYFPFKLRDNYYKKGIEYFDNFNGFDDREILGVEEEYFFKIEDYNFRGKLDIECPSEIIDHKTKGRLHLLRLTKKHNKNDYIKMIDGRYIHFTDFVQQYTYCIPYKEKYGKYPKLLNLNMVRLNDWYTVEFNEDDFERSKKWLTNKITSIYNAKEFLRGENITEFWCSYICSQRYNCPYSDKYIDTQGASIYES